MPSDLPEPPRDPCTLELTTREVKLLLKYGYPFDEAEQPLRASRAVKGYHRVQIDAYWLEMLLADLSRSTREVRSQSLAEELDALCSVLESALHARSNTRRVRLV